MFDKDNMNPLVSLVGLLVFLFLCLGALAVAFSGPIGTQVETNKIEVETEQIIAEAEQTQAKANEILAEAEADSAQAELEEAKGNRALLEAKGRAEVERAAGERIMREAEGNALESAVNTSNRLITLWGISFPLAIPWTLIIGMILGGCASGGIAYYKGFRTGLAEGKDKSQPAPQTPQMPDPELDGG